MKVAIHQPNYIPSMRYFYKISLVDIFVFLDDVDFSRGGYENRNKILINNEPKWLSIPVNKGIIKNLQYAKDWKRKHRDTIRFNYKNSRNFDTIFNIYVRSLEYDFAEMNIYYIKEISKLLGYKTTFLRQSHMNVTGRKSELLNNILFKVWASEYITGRNNYLEDLSIPITYLDYKAPNPELSSIHDLMVTSL